MSEKKVRLIIMNAVFSTKTCSAFRDGDFGSRATSGIEAEAGSSTRFEEKGRHPQWHVEELPLAVMNAKHLLLVLKR